MKDFTWIDKSFINWFIMITGFCNIITITTLIGDPRFDFSSTTKFVLSMCCLFMGVSIAYFKLRMIGLLLFGGKKNGK